MTEHYAMVTFVEMNFLCTTILIHNHVTILVLLYGPLSLEGCITRSVYNHMGAYDSKKQVIKSSILCTLFHGNYGLGVKVTR